MTIKEWNAQEFYNLYCKTKEQWIIYNTLNHEMFLPATDTTILTSCEGRGSTFIHCGCVLFHPDFRTNPFSLLPFQVAFLVQSLFPTAVLAGLPNLTPNLVPRLQPSNFPSGVMSLCSK